MTWLKIKQRIEHAGITDTDHINLIHLSERHDLDPLVVDRRINEDGLVTIEIY